jgi:hypothetical protein
VSNAFSVSCGGPSISMRLEPQNDFDYLWTNCNRHLPHHLFGTFCFSPTPRPIGLPS